MQRNIIPIRKAASYIGARSVSSIYELIKTDPAFARLWFRINGRTLAFEDQLVAYAENRAETGRIFAPAPAEKRRRGRPRKQLAEDQVNAT